MPTMMPVGRQILASCGTKIREFWRPGRSRHMFRRIPHALPMNALGMTAKSAPLASFPAFCQSSSAEAYVSPGGVDPNPDPNPLATNDLMCPHRIPGDLSDPRTQDLK